MRKHTFCTQSDGTIVSFTDAVHLWLYLSVTDSTLNYNYSRTEGVTASKWYKRKCITISKLGHDMVSSYYGSKYQLAKTMSLVKSKQGTAVSQGREAKLQVTVDSQVYFDTSQILHNF